MVWSPSTSGRTGHHGHPHSLLDDYLEFVAARARPNTLLAVAYDLKVFFTVIGKEPADITTGERVGLHQGAMRAAPGREGRAPRGRRGGLVGPDDQAAPGEPVGAVRLPRRPRRRRGGGEPCPSRPGGPTAESAGRGPWGAADPSASHAAAGAGTRRGGRVRRCAWHAARPGNGRGDGA